MVKERSSKRQRTNSSLQSVSSEEPTERSARLEALSEHNNDEQGSRSESSPGNNKNDLAITVQEPLSKQMNDDLRRLGKDTPAELRNYLNHLLAIINKLILLEKIDCELPFLKDLLLAVQNQVTCSEYNSSVTLTASIKNLAYWISENSFMSDEQSSKRAEIYPEGAISSSTVAKMIDGVYIKLKNKGFYRNKVIPVRKLSNAIEQSIKMFLYGRVPEESAVTVVSFHTTLRAFFTSFNVDNLLAEEISAIDETIIKCSNHQFYGNVHNIIEDWILYLQLASVEKRRKKNTDIHYLNTLKHFHHFINQINISELDSLLRFVEQELLNAENRRLVVSHRHFKNLARQAIKTFVLNEKTVEFHAYHEGVWNKNGKSFEELIGKEEEEEEEELSNEDEDDTIIGLEEYIAEFTKMAPYEKMPKKLSLTLIAKNVLVMVDGSKSISVPVQNVNCEWSLRFGRVGDNMSFFLICENSKTEPWQIDVNVTLKVISEGGTEWEKKHEVVTLKHDMDNKSIGFRDFMEWGRMETEYLWNDQLLLKAEVTFTRMEGLSREKILNFEAESNYPDAVLVAGGEKFHIARATLAPQSTHFKDLFSDDQRKWKVYDMNIENVDRKDWQCFLEMCHLAPAVNDSNVKGVLCLSKEVGAKNITRMAEEFLLSRRSNHSMATKLELAAEFGLENLRTHVFESVYNRLELRAVHTNRLKDLDPSIVNDIFFKRLELN